MAKVKALGSIEDEPKIPVEGVKIGRLALVVSVVTLTMSIIEPAVRLDLGGWPPNCRRIAFNFCYL